LKSSPTKETNCGNGRRSTTSVSVYSVSIE
jgi:hypothetical protein